MILAGVGVMIYFITKIFTQTGQGGRHYDHDKEMRVNKCKDGETCDYLTGEEDSSCPPQITRDDAPNPGLLDPTGSHGKCDSVMICPYLDPKADYNPTVYFRDVHTIHGNYRFIDWDSNPTQDWPDKKKRSYPYGIIAQQVLAAPYPSLYFTAVTIATGATERYHVAHQGCNKGVAVTGGTNFVVWDGADMGAGIVIGPSRVACTCLNPMRINNEAMTPWNSRVNLDEYRHYQIQAVWREDRCLADTALARAAANYLSDDDDKAECALSGCSACSLPPGYCTHSGKCVDQQDGKTRACAKGLTSTCKKDPKDPEKCIDGSHGGITGNTYAQACTHDTDCPSYTHVCRTTQAGDPAKWVPIQDPDTHQQSAAADCAPLLGPCQTPLPPAGACVDLPLSGCSIWSEGWGGIADQNWASILGKPAPYQYVNAFNWAPSPITKATAAVQTAQQAYDKCISTHTTLECWPELDALSVATTVLEETEKTSPPKNGYCCPKICNRQLGSGTNGENWAATAARCPGWSKTWKGWYLQCEYPAHCDGDHCAAPGGPDINKACTHDSDCASYSAPCTADTQVIFPDPGPLQPDGSGNNVEHFFVCPYLDPKNGYAPSVRLTQKSLLHGVSHEIPQSLASNQWPDSGSRFYTNCFQVKKTDGGSTGPSIVLLSETLTGPTKGTKEIVTISQTHCACAKGFDDTGGPFRTPEISVLGASNYSVWPGVLWQDTQDDTDLLRTSATSINSWGPWYRNTKSAGVVIGPALGSCSIPT